MVDYSYNKTPKDLLFYFMSCHVPVARISNIELLSYPFILDHVVEYITTESMQNHQLCAWVQSVLKLMDLCRKKEAGLPVRITGKETETIDFSTIDNIISLHLRMHPFTGKSLAVSQKICQGLNHHCCKICCNLAPCWTQNVKTTTRKFLLLLLFLFCITQAR